MPPRIPQPHPIRATDFTRPHLGVLGADVQRPAPSSGSGQTGYYHASPGIQQPQNANGIPRGLAASQPFPDNRDGQAPTPVSSELQEFFVTPDPRSTVED